MNNIYLDYAATTPVDPRVMKAMEPYFSKIYGNTMSLHKLGRKAAEAVEKSRTIIASYINANPDEIVFTGSATESNNLVLKGTAFAEKGKKHMIISSIEHDCVLGASRWLMQQGFEVDQLPVNQYGLVDIEVLKRTIRNTTLLVSVIHGNNEVGTIQDIKNIGSICKEAGVYFHTDAAQSFGKMPIDVKKMNIDMLTASSHKIYGPKGAAILFIRNGVKIEPLLHGGGHENKMRSSTLNVPAIVGFGKAVKILRQEGTEENKRLSRLRDVLIESIIKNMKKTRLNGHPNKRLSNNVNISFQGVEGESLLLELDFNGVAVSTGSACSSRTLMPSHVLTAMGLGPQEAHGSIRFSLGRWTTEAEIDRAVEIVSKAVKKLRKLSPF
jgi:cysteine desulfurase